MADYWVKFGDNGVPTSHSGSQVEGYEFVQNVTDEQLCTMRRRLNGTWVLRGKDPDPTPEEIEAERLLRREERREQRRMERDAARRERLFDKLIEVAERLDPTFAAAVAELEAEFRDEEV
jgi:hypothetical protein